MSTARIILYNEPAFNGRSLTIQNAQNVPPDFRTSSCKVLEGNWELFEEPNFEGDSKVAEEGAMYPIMEDVGIGNKTLSSLRPF